MRDLRLGTPGPNRPVAVRPGQIGRAVIMGGKIHDKWGHKKRFCGPKIHL